MAEGGRRAALFRQRLLQVGFVLAAVLAVLVADRTSERMLVLDGGLQAQRLATALGLCGRAVGGWALGMAFRLQFARTVASDRQARLLLGVPACLVAAWPVLVTFLPPGVSARAPGWLAGGLLTGVAPFAAVVLGLVLSLGVTGTRR